MEGKGIDQSEGIPEQLIFYDVAINIESVVPVVVSNKGMDKRVLVHHYDR